MRLTRSGANDLPVRHTTGRTYGHQHDKAAFAGRSWTRGRARSKPRGKVLGAAPHSGDLLARSDPPRGSPRGSQDAGVEHHPVHRPSSTTCRRRLEVAPLTEATVLGGLQRGECTLERHPAPSCETVHRITDAMGPRRPVAHNVPLTCEGDVPHGVTLHPGFPTRNRQDRDDRRREVVRPDGEQDGRDLPRSRPPAPEGDVRGDTVRASSPSGPTVLRQTGAYSGSHRPSRREKGEEG